MSPQPLDSRVERLERRMTTLEGLPDRVGALESQIVQLRGEMRSEFSALRGEMKAMGERLEATIQESRNHARVLFEEVLERISRIGEGPSRGPRRKR